MGTFHFIVLNKGSSLPCPPPASAALTGTHLPPRPRARPPRASIAAGSEVPALPRDSGRVIYRDTGKEHRQGGETSARRLGTVFLLPSGIFRSVGDTEWQKQDGMLRLSFWDASSGSVTVGTTHCTFHSCLFPGKPVGFLMVQSPATCSQDTSGLQAPPGAALPGAVHRQPPLCLPSSAPLQLLQADKKHVGFFLRAAADPHGQGFPVELQAAGRGQGLTPGTVWGWIPG